MKRWAAVLVALAAGSCTVPIDPQAASIPADLALTKLKELLPKASYVSFLEPRVAVDQTEIRGWKVDSTGLEFQTSRKGPFRLAWTDCRGSELVKVPLRYELRVFASVQSNKRKDVLRINYRDENDARRAAELFEALRGDR